MPTIELLFPLAALGLCSLPFILLLHMMRNRRALRPIPSLALWEGLQQQRRGTRIQSIPLTLLLLLQLCALLGMVIALSRPVSSAFLAEPQQTIFILDTTTSMQAATDASLTESRFEVARRQIRSQIEGSNPDDTIALISLNSEPRLHFITTPADADSPPTPTALDQAQALAALAEIPVGATGLDLPAALTLASSLIDPNRNNRLVVLTDGNYTLDPTTLPPIPIQIEWVNLGLTPLDNQALLNVSTQTQPDGTHRLFARILNNSTAAVQRSVRLSVDGESAERRLVKVGANSETAQIWTISQRNAQTVRLEIEEPDALPADNVAEVWLESSTRYQILLQTAPTEDDPAADASPNDESQQPSQPPLQRALQAQPNVDLTVQQRPTPIDGSEAAGELDAFDLIILENPTLDLTELADLPSGNLLLVNPRPTTADPPIEPTAGILRVDSETAAAWLREIEFSGVYFNRIYSPTLPSWAEVSLATLPTQYVNPTLDLVTGTLPLIWRGTDGQRQIMGWTFDIGAANSNLSARLAFPLLVDSSLSTLLTPLPPATLFVGQPLRLDNPNLTIELPDGRRLNPFGSRDPIFRTTQQAGIYRLYQSGNPQPAAGFAVQAGSAFESNLQRNGLQQVIPLIPRSAETGITREPELVFTDYWPLFASVVLAIIALEGWIVWRS